MSIMLATQRPDSSGAIDRLEGVVTAFLQVSRCESRFDLESEVLIASRRLSAVLTEARRCEIEGIGYDRILQALEPLRKELRRGELWRRTQDWPRGYPGDFETIEMMV